MQTTEGQLIPATPAPKKEKRLRLGSIREVKRELIKLCSAAKTGKIPTQDASRLTFMLQSLSNMIRDSELEERIQKLEASQNEKLANKNY